LQPLYLGRADATGQIANPVAVVTVPAASFELVPVAPDTIVSAFGTQLATQFAIASTLPLPTTLGGTTVTVNGRPAGLLFVSGGQINYVMPTILRSARLTSPCAPATARFQMDRCKLD